MDRPRRRGATLIEMIVVIAIIATLTAILVPAVVGVKAAAKKSSCVGNLHQIAVASVLYVGDSDDVLPYAIDEISRQQKYDLIVRTDWSRIAPNLQNIPSIVKLLKAYGAADETFRCPEDRPIESLLGDGLVPPYYPRFGSSYKFLPTLSLFTTTTVPNPDRNSYAFDADHFHVSPYDFRVNDMHFDGHVAFDKLFVAGAF